VQLQMPGPSSISRPVGPRNRPLWPFRTDSCDARRQFAPLHSQIAQGKQRRAPRSVLSQPAIAHLGVAELALESAKRMLNLDADARLDSLQLVDHGGQRSALVQCSALAGSHGNQFTSISGLCVPTESAGEKANRETRVDVKAEVEAIRSGKADFEGDKFIINDCTYGHHDGVLFPISGPGFYSLDRGEYKEFAVYKSFGNSEFAEKILDNMRVDFDSRRKALEVWKAMK
jgi:hypothetical protein